MATNAGHVMNLANSIIGVSVLAMPFCFKECGIMLAIILLLLSSVITRLACHFLVKASHMIRRKNFEFLAFYAFGSSGKLFVEMGVIGFMMGTCVAFFVVIGDLGPAIVSKLFEVSNTSTLRLIVLISVGLFVVLPLGLLKNIESLTAVSTVTICFYGVLIIKIFSESLTHLVSGDWTDKVHFWRPEGLIQCFPIFAMALSCQMQIFEIQETIPNATLDRMNTVVRSAVNMCTMVYIAVGMLGYVAFSSRHFTGNILMSFSPSPVSELCKLGFVLSLAASFPLVIFPCRASLHSLLFKKIPIHHELGASGTSSHIPDYRFKALTLCIVSIALATGILIPNIELVLGLVGSTIGVAICVIFPSIAFVNLTNKNTNERIIAKTLFVVGVAVMMVGTYGNLYAAAEVKPIEVAAPPPPPRSDVLPIVPGKGLELIKDDDAIQDKIVVPSKSPPLQLLEVERKPEKRKEPAVPEPPEPVKRKEPPVPQPPLEIKPAEVPEPVPPEIKPIPDIKPVKDLVKEPSSSQKTPEKPNVEVEKLVETKLVDIIHKDAIEKEEREEQEDEKQKKSEEEKKKEELLKTLKEHEDEQKKLLQEQQKILKEMKSRVPEKKEEIVAPKNTDFNVEEKINQIDSAKLSENIEKIEDVISDLKDKKDQLQKEKTNEVIEEKKVEVKKVDEVVVEKQPVQKEADIRAMPLPLVKLNNLKKEIQSKQEALGRDILEQKRSKRNVNNNTSELSVGTEEKNCESKDGPQQQKTEVGDKEVSKDVAERSALGNSTVIQSKVISDSQHLSVPEESKFDDNLRDVDNVLPNVVPKKRDLKSVEEERTKKSFRIQHGGIPKRWGGKFPTFY